MNHALANGYPKLRPLDIRPQAHNGQPYFVLRDPLQLSDKMLLVPQPLAAVLPFCDGTRDAHDVATAFSQHYGVRLDTATVEELLAAMDNALLLENEHSTAAHRYMLEQYRQAPFRPPLLAGQGYPGQAHQLRSLLESYLDVARRDLNGYANRGPSGAPFGLLSPHIDYPRGGAVYAQVWAKAVEEIRQADLAILIGTDHYGNDPFTLTHQSYATPYGTLPTAKQVVNQLAGVIGDEAAFAGELRHRGEHSLELVAVWLHHMRNGKPCELVPILVGSLHRFIYDNSSPATDATIHEVLDALRNAMEGRRAVVIASGDLSHVGPAFGGKPLDAACREAVQADDKDIIAQMQAGNAEGFFSSIRTVRDRNNVCGVTPIYLTMRLLGDIKGEQAGYATCPADEEDTSAVTVTGMLFR